MLFILVLLAFINSLPMRAEAQTTLNDHIEPTSPCLQQPYKISIFNHRPLVIYVEDFVSEDEAAQLIALASDSYQESQVVIKEDPENHAATNISHRLSQSKYLYDDDAPLIRCIRERAARFQGISVQYLEPLQVVRYPKNGFFKHHWDYFSRVDSLEGLDCNGDFYCQEGMGDRASTFFVYLKADCEGGETDFPRLEMGEHVDRHLWCEFIDCRHEDPGVKWKPKAGNAIFWENMLDGKGIEDVLHAGLPVSVGEKIGLNIWSRQRSGRIGEGENFGNYLDGATPEESKKILQELDIKRHVEL
ncbi:Prolyl 4-hydroxylase 1 [Hyphodiscus hymeniophilus]|uniref:Prolyl 4-hydroxylase 1 n=1 Tax=Hyphodiscus hymeniophilus TaxID=353542 RepID=A0A9P6SR03_9HELO|nr:Prolyl 4-hydroxylase 1 [Hyphodiscus hymeniophilus]